MQVDEKPLYNNGDYSIYYYNQNHFVHTYKNIVICERGAANKALIDNLVNDIKPTTEAAIYHDYERLKDAIRIGTFAAKKLNFQIK
jgi:hypothetical protein